MPATALAALLFLATQAAPQAATAGPRRADSPRELAGFMLGQFSRNVEKKLGKPDRVDTDDDGETLWTYELAPEAETTLTFSIGKDDEKTITAIMLAGKPKPGAGSIAGVELGMTKAELVERLGEPDDTEKREESEGESEGEGLDWKDRNFYVEVNDEGKVDWLEIDDTPEGYPAVGDRKPDLAGFAKALQSRERGEILEWLCADVEIDTKADARVGFVGSPREDLLDESSLIARYLYGGEGSLRERLTPELARTKAQERKTDEGNPYWAYVFPAGAPIREIVFWFEAGRWRVYHVILPDAKA